MLRDGKLPLNERLCLRFFTASAVPLKRNSFSLVKQVSVTKEGGIYMKKVQPFSTKALVSVSLLTAMSIIFTRFFSFIIPIAGLPALRFGLGEAPLMMAGMVYGPALGGLGGLAADLIGVVVNPQGAYFPGFTLSSMLWGILPGLFFYKRNNKNINIKGVFIVVSITYFIVSICLTTYWLSIMFGKGFLVLVPGRLLSSVVAIPLDSVMVSTYLKYSKKYYAGW